MHSNSEAIVRTKSSNSEAIVREKHANSEKKAQTKTGFHEDLSTVRFCTVLIMSAIDEARRYDGQPDTPTAITQDQLHARYFLVARENRAMIFKLVEAMGVDPDWFFSRVLKPLIVKRWPPVPRKHRKASRLHGAGLHLLFEEK